MDDATYCGPPLVKQGVTLTAGDRVRILAEDDSRYIVVRDHVTFHLSNRSVSQDEAE